MRISLATAIGKQFDAQVSGFRRLRFHKHLRSLTRLFLFAFLGNCGVAQVTVLTAHNDIGRTGQNLQETILTPANVNSTMFGKLFSAAVTGTISAQPLYVSGVTIPGKGSHNVVYAATQSDYIYAFDADNNAGANSTPLWSVSLLNNGTSSGLTSRLGVLGTPVIDLSSNTIYLVSSEFSGTAAIFRLHALDITSGAEKLGGPITIHGSISGTGTASVGGILAFDPNYEIQRPGLLFLNGVVYVAFGSQGDEGPYHGWIFSYNAASLAQLDIYCDSPNGSAGGIWLSGAGLTAEVNDPAKPYGRMFVVTGNGSFSATSPYSNSMSYGMSVVNLDLTGGVMTVYDEFTPHNEAALDVQDGDLGSGSAVILPPQPLSSDDTLYPMAQVGKSGTIYILDRNRLGGFNAAGDNIVQEIQTPESGPETWGAGIWGSPAYWNQHLYFGGVNTDASNSLVAYSFIDGKLSSAPTSQSLEKFFAPTPTPSISANGEQNGIVWALDSSGVYDDGPQILLAHNANDLGSLLYSSSYNPSRDTPGVAVKYTVPTIANGKVYVPAIDELSVYGLLNGTTAAASPAFAPSSGIFAGSQTVTISDATAGTQIFYTTNGSTPTASSELYTGPIQVTTSETIKAIAVAGGFLPSEVSSGTYDNALSSAQMQLNGSATSNDSSIELTNGGAFQAASAFYSTPLNIQSFTTDFTFQLLSPGESVPLSGIADGFTFTIQNAGSHALGNFGGSLGYAPIGKSVAIKFDLHNNAGEGPNSTGLYTEGTMPTVYAINLTGTGIDLHSGHKFNANFTYNGSDLVLTLTDQVTSAIWSHSFAINIPLAVDAYTAYVGFTAGTGSASAIQQVLTWTFTNQ